MKLILGISAALTLTCVVFIVVARALGANLTRPLMAFTTSRTGNTEIFLWDNGYVVNFTHHPQTDSNPVWSHDGHLVFVSNRLGRDEVYVLDLEGQLTNASNAPQADDMHPAWSADGRLAFISNRDGDFDVYVTDSHTLTHISNLLDTDEVFPAWSADGRLAFISSDFGFSDVFVYDAGAAVNVSNDALSEDWYPAWSADGRLAYLSYRGTVNMNLHIADPDMLTHSTPAQDYHAQASLPAWSANGLVAFAAFDQRNNTEIFVFDLTNGTISNITQDAAWDGSPQWLADGRLAFISNRSGSMDVFIYDPASGTTTNLTPYPSTEDQFAWWP
jgi:Tol biopolymer transport system component